MSSFITHVLAFGGGIVVAIAGFVWMNRNQPSALDAAEDWDRKRHP